MAGETTPFEALRGVRYGRLTPTDWTPVEGTHVCCLGSAQHGLKFDFNYDDEVRIAQVADITGVRLIYFKAYIVPPPEMPPGFVWALVWGIQGQMTGRYALRPGKRSRLIYTGAIDVSQIGSGEVSVEFALRVEAT